MNHQGKEKQNDSEMSPHTCQDIYYQKTQKSVFDDVEKLEPLHTVGRKAKWYNYYGKQ